MSSQARHSPKRSIAGVTITRLRQTDRGHAGTNRRPLGVPEAPEDAPDRKPFIGHAPGCRSEDLTELRFLGFVGSAVASAEVTPVAAEMNLPREFAREDTIGLDAGPQGLKAR